MSRRRAASLCAAALVVLAAAGCGSGDDESATVKWADGLCSAANTYRDSLTSVGSSLKSGGPTRSDLDEAAKEIKSATDTFVSDVTDLGTPETSAGQQAKEQVDALADQLGESVDSIESSTENLSSASDVLSAISAVSSTLATAGGEVKSTVKQLEALEPNGELQDAFDQADSCKSLSSG